MKLYLEGFYFCHSLRETKPSGPHRGENMSIFSTSLYQPNVANLPNYCDITLTVTVSVKSDNGNSRWHVGNDCLQGFELLELIRPFVSLLRHGHCLVKNIKSIRKLEMLKNEKWKTGSFI
jgi:hypothetical protein